MALRETGLDGQDVLYWLAADHARSGERIGTTSVVLNEAGDTIVAESPHYPYGEERWRSPESGTFPTDLRFTGQRKQPTLGDVYHVGARFLDVSIARWLSADTIVPEPTDPQSFNRYSWVVGKPLRYVETSGHLFESDGGGGPKEDSDPEEPTEEPLQTPVYPFWDREHGAVRHLVETCQWDECSAVVFNAYTPGGWDFNAADRWHTATSEVYNVGPVAEAEALQAAKEGRPNPLSEEQFSEGLTQRPNSSFPAEYYVTNYIRMWLPYHFLFEHLGWSPAEMGLGNFEPR